MKNVASDLADEVHQSCVGGFGIPKRLDVKGCQQQRVGKMQQGQKQTQSAHQTHPGSEQTSRNDFSSTFLEFQILIVRHRAVGMC